MDSKPCCNLRRTKPLQIANSELQTEKANDIETVNVNSAPTSTETTPTKTNAETAQLVACADDAKSQRLQAS